MKKNPTLLLLLTILFSVNTFSQTKDIDIKVHGSIKNYK
jgi:hypothetical protein